MSGAEGPAPMWRVNVQEPEDRIEILMAERGAYWSRIDLRPTVPLTFALRSEAGASGPTASPGEWTRITLAPDPIEAGDELDFCAPGGEQPWVRVEFLDRPTGTRAEAFEFQWLAACS